MVSVQKLALYTALIVIVFVLSELAAYFWHRYMAHRSLLHRIIPLEEVSISHQFHHRSELDHDASEDFVWILLGLSSTFLVLGVCYNLFLHRYINSTLLSILLVTALASFIINWYVHLAVHTEGHWLESLGSYIEDTRAIHFVHHRIPRKNYSIINFTDTMLGTYSCGFNWTQKEVEQILHGELDN